VMHPLPTCVLCSQPPVLPGPCLPGRITAGCG
jgi:hypothetical protein